MATTGFGFNVTGADSAFVFDAESGTRDGPNREYDEVTKLNGTAITGTQHAKEFLPHVIDPGTITAEGYADPDAAVQPPISLPVEVLTLTYPLKTGESTAAKEVGDGFLSGLQWIINVGVLKWRLTWKLSGVWVHTAGSA